MKGFKQEIRLVTGFYRWIWRQKQGLSMNAWILSTKRPVLQGKNGEVLVKMKII